MKNIRYMVFSGIFSALTAVCSWISLPFPGGSFTLQLFAVFLSLEILGAKWGSISIVIYLLLGCMGLPVFSGFQGGLGVLAGPTGGFLVGFLAIGLVCRLVKGLPGRILGLASCYVLGCVWYQFLSGAPWQAALLSCVVPYLLPDALKLWLALNLSRQVKARLKL